MAKGNKRAKASAQPIAHVVSSAELEADPSLVAAGIEAGDEVEILDAQDGIPSFTIRADSLFGIRCMIAVASHSAMLPVDEQRAIALKLRQFDLYEEAHR